MTDNSHFRQHIQAALYAQNDALHSMKGSLATLSLHAEQTCRHLDYCSYSLEYINERLHQTVDFLDDVEAIGPRNSLDMVIDILRSECLDQTAGKYHRKYNALLTQALSVRDDIRRGLV